MSLLAGLSQGMAQGKAAKKDRESIDEFKKTQKKLIEAQIDSLVATNNAKERFLGMMQQDSSPGPGMEGPPEQPRPGLPFSEIATNAEFQRYGLMSGMVSPKDIGLEKERQNMEDFSKNLNKGGGLGFTPDSERLFAATKDPKTLEPIKPEKVTVQTKDGPRIITVNPYTGEQIADIGPAKEEKLPVGDAGKIQSIDFANKQLNDAIDILAPNGELDKSLVLQMSVPVKVGKAREIDQLVTEAITTKVLIQSGVTARQEEIDAAKERFIPNAFDLTNPGLAQRKLERLKQFMSGTIDLTVLPPSLRKRIEEKNKKESSKSSGWTKEKQKRLEELRKKQTEGKL